MTNSDKEEVITQTLQECFPRAGNIQIIEKEEKNDDLHFTSEIIQLTVEYQRDGVSQTKHLIMKVPSTGPAYAFYTKSQTYAKEAQAYDQLIPRVNDLLHRQITPTHYFTSKSNILVLENVAKQGYKVGGKLDFLDLEPGLTILQTLAQFHAATYKIRAQNPAFLNGSAYYNTLCINSRLAFIDTWLPLIETLLRRRNSAYLIPKVKKAIDALRVDEADLYAWVEQRLKFVVLNHGDYRKENLLLKYDARNRVEDVKLIDFQTCWWSSPVYDFIIAIMFSVRIEVIEEHFETLVQSYLDNVKKALAEFECSCDYESNDFMNDLRKFHFVIIGCLLARCTFTSPLDHDNMVKTFILKDEMTDSTREECLNDETFTGSLFRWLKFSEKLGVFDSVDEWFKLGKL